MEVIEVSIPSEENIGKTYQHKLYKYGELVQSLAKTHHKKCKIRPVIIGAKGSPHKSTANTLTNLGVDLAQAQRIVLNWSIKISDLVLCA